MPPLSSAETSVSEVFQNVKFISPQDGFKTGRFNIMMK